MLPKKKIYKKDLVAVDLFCGAGGLTYGLRKSKIDVIVGYDIDEDSKFPFEYNNKNSKFEEKDIKTLSPTEVSRNFHKNCIKILVGCAPCQPFSSYSQRYKNDHTGKRWSLLEKFREIIKEVRPDIVSMENVPNLRKEEIFKTFKTTLKKLEYCVEEKIIDCAEYGVPQHRKRLVLLASRYAPITLIHRTHSEYTFKTVRKTIEKLEPIAAGDVSRRDSLHRSSRLSPLNLKRIRASEPGGSWKTWEKSLIAKCHRRKSGRTYPGVYGRMEWDKPSPTITTQSFGFGNGRFGHPVEDRAISLREAALLQTFPASYQFVEPGKPIYFKKVGRLIGNAVPVRLGEIIGRSIVKHLKRNRVI